MAPQIGRGKSHVTFVKFGNLHLRTGGTMTVEIYTHMDNITCLEKKISSKWSGLGNVTPFAIL